MRLVVQMETELQGVGRVVVDSPAEEKLEEAVRELAHEEAGGAVVGVVVERRGAKAETEVRPRE